MKKWLNNNGDDLDGDKSLKNLEKALARVQRKGLSIGERSLMRGSLIRRIRTDSANLPASSYRLASKIRLRGKKLEMPLWAKFVVRERVLDYVETSRNWQTGVSSNERLSWQGYLATFLLVTLSVSLLSVFPVEQKVVMAKATTLDSVSGEVFVKRNNVLLRGVDDLELRRGDKVITRGDGLATIKFFNDSITRLNSNTDVNLIAMDREYVNPLVSKIEIYLQEGRLWANVINLPDNSSFEVKTDDMSAGTEKKAAFDVEVKDNKTQVAVFNNVVKIKPHRSDRPSKTVISGYQAFADDNLDEITVEKMMDKDDIIISSAWVAENLSSDDEYKDELIENKEEEVLETEKEDIVDDVDVSDDTGVIEVAFSNEKALELKQRFDELQKRLVSGEAQLIRGHRTDGINHLKFYKNELTHIKNETDLGLADDPENRDALYVYMNGVIDQQLSDLSATLPGDRLYRAKEYLQEVAVNMAKNEVDRVEVQLSQAGDTLLEMEDLINEDKAYLVSTLLKRYKSKSEEVVGVIDDGSLDMGHDKKIDLIKTQVAQVKVLTAIQRSLVDNELYDLRDRVELLRGEMLKAFVTALDAYPGEIPVDVVVDVKDLYDTYISDVANDDIGPVMQKLSGDDYQMTFIDPAAEGVEDGNVVTMPSLEATPEVKDMQSIDFGDINLNSNIKWDILDAR